VTTEVFVPEITYCAPHLRIRWDQSAVKIAPREAIRRLRDGNPSIELRSSPDNCIEVGVWLLQASQAQIVARQIHDVLKSAV
jgi:hypothetical protein